MSDFRLGVDWDDKGYVSWDGQLRTPSFFQSLRPQRQQATTPTGVDGALISNIRSSYNPGGDSGNRFNFWLDTGRYTHGENDFTTGTTTFAIYTLRVSTTDVGMECEVDRNGVTALLKADTDKSLYIVIDDDVYEYETSDARTTSRFLIWTTPTIAADWAGEEFGLVLADSGQSAAILAYVENDLADPLPVASIDSVDVSDPPDGNENTTVTLEATLGDGVYDSITYAWTTTHGTLDDATAAAPVWTRPDVMINTTATIGLTVTVEGDGTLAQADTSATASAGETSVIFNVVALPDASIASVTIDDIPNDFSQATETLGATLGAGTYDTITYDWSATIGAFDDNTLAAPVWTRPPVGLDFVVTVRLTVTVEGTGTLAKNGTSATAMDTETTTVLYLQPPAAINPITINTVPDGDEGTDVTLGVSIPFIRADTTLYAWSATHGTFDDATVAAPVWTRPAVAADTDAIISLTVTAEGTGTNARNGTSAMSSDTEETTILNAVALPDASIASVTIDSIADGNENTQVTLGATLGAGVYDVVNYFWSTDQGTFDDATSATPVWTRPAVTANTVATINLSIRVDGTGTLARNGTSAVTVDTEEPTILNLVVLPVASITSVAVNDIPDGDEGTTIQLGLTVAGTYDSLLYRWAGAGGGIDDATIGNPMWTRPQVATNTTYNIRCRVTPVGDGTTARVGSGTPAVDAEMATVVNVVPRPVASIASVTIDAVADGNDGTAVTLGATLGNGTYDDISYDWSVDEGTLDDNTLAAPVWTRPIVAANTDATISLTVTVDGDGTTARNGTSDTATDTEATTIIDLPQATLASATIDAIPAGDEGTTVRLTATLGTGTYDELTYLWTATGATLNDSTLASPTLTRPAVSADTDFTVTLAVVPMGDGTTAQPGTSSVIRRDSETYRVLNIRPVASIASVTIDAVANGNEGSDVTLGATLGAGTYDDVSYNWSVDEGTLDDNTLATPVWTRPATTANTDATISLTVTVEGDGTLARNGTTAMATDTEDTTIIDLPVASIASVAVNDVPNGNEGTTVTLGATLGTGTYDALTYAWSVSHGALDDATAAAPVWTLPSVMFNTTATIALVVTAEGEGTLAQDGTSATARAGDTAVIFNVVTLPVASITSVTIDDVPNGNDGTDVTLGATLGTGAYDDLTYDWSVTHGTLDDNTLAAPVWTRPIVTANTDATISLTVTAEGTDTLAQNNTSDTATDTEATTIIDLPQATLASATIDAIPAGDEGTTVRLTATLGEGVYDDIAYTWTAPEDVLNAANFVSPTLTRPAVSADTNFTVQLAVAPIGDGTTAQPGFGAIIRDSETYRVLNIRPVASIASVTIDAVANGNEGSDVTLGATLGAGTYDDITYNWSVSHGTLDDNTLAAPVWTRPTATANISATISLTVTVEGTGTNARNGTSAMASDTEATTIIDLPVASIASVAITAVPNGNEGTTITLGATLGAGTYDALTYAWSVSHGTLDDNTLSAPVWTRPAVAADTDATISLTVTAVGGGTLAQSGTSDTAMDTEATEVLNVIVLPVASIASVVITDVPNGNEGTQVTLGATLGNGAYDDLTYNWSVTHGTLDDNTLAAPVWTRPAATANISATISLTVTAEGTGTLARNGTSDTARDTEATTIIDLPVASIASVTINAVANANEGTTVRLGATLGAGTYDALTYAWSVSHGALNDATIAAPTWTRPAVAANTNATISLIVTAEGEGTLAQSGTSDTATDTEATVVLNVVVLPVASIASVTIDAVPDGKEGFAVTLGATLGAGAYDDITYNWSVDEGTLDDNTLATPVWTRPATTANTDATITLIVTVDGTGTLARNGTSDTAMDTEATTIIDLPDASIASVTINAVADGDEATEVMLSATLGDFVADGLTRLWSVSHGTLSSENAPSPTWTRPIVTTDTDVTISLTVTAFGGGNAAAFGTRATAMDTETTTVLNIVLLSAPIVSINPVATGRSETPVVLTPNISGGAYDTITYRWFVAEGTIQGATTETPIWMRPEVTTQTRVRIRLSVSVSAGGNTLTVGAIADAFVQPLSQNQHLDNITQHVVNMSWRLGVKDYYDNIAHEGTLKITLDNEDSSFSPNNVDSEYAGLFRQNLRVFLEVWHTGNSRWERMWSGWTTSFGVSVGQRSDRKATIDCKQGLYQLREGLFRYNPSDIGGRVKETIQELMNRANIKVLDTQLFAPEDGRQDSFNDIEYIGDGWNASTKLEKAIKELLDSEHYRLFLNRRGQYLGLNREVFMNYGQPGKNISLNDSHGAKYEYTSDIINEVEMFFTYKSIEEADVWSAKNFFRCPENGRSESALMNFEFEEGAPRAVDNTSLNFDDITWETYQRLPVGEQRDLEDRNMSVHTESDGEGRTLISFQNDNPFEVFTKISGVKGNTVRGGNQDSFRFTRQAAISQNGLVKREEIRTSILEDYWHLKALAEVQLIREAEPAGEFTEMTWIATNSELKDFILDTKIGDRVYLTEDTTKEVSLPHVIVSEKGMLVGKSHVKMVYGLVRLNNNRLGVFGDQLPVIVGI